MLHTRTRASVRESRAWGGLVGESGLVAARDHLLSNRRLGFALVVSPQAALAACGEGIDFCERRGIAEFALGIAAMRPTFLAELGQPEQALAEALPMAERLEAASDVTSVEPRSLHLRLSAERGVHGQASAADELVATARESGEPQMIAMAFTAAARLLLLEGHPQPATELLVELTRVPRIHAEPYHVAELPRLVRTALTLGEPELAARLADGVEPVTPLFEHALSACRAELAEAAGEHAEAAQLYAEAAKRWREFGNVPEHAYAVFGQGRCLTALGKSEAEGPLRTAREALRVHGVHPGGWRK